MATSPLKLVKFTTWHAGYRTGETAGFPPEEADRLCKVDKVAEPFLTEAERGKVEAAAKKAAEAAAEKAALEAKAEEDRKKKDEADQKKAGGGR